MQKQNIVYWEFHKYLYKIRRKEIIRSKKEELNGNKGRTSLFENGLIWFGAGLSIAEILTGTSFAPLGFGKGILAIIIGHIIGCLMLFCAGIHRWKKKEKVQWILYYEFWCGWKQIFCIFKCASACGMDFYYDL